MKRLHINLNQCALEIQRDIKIEEILCVTRTCNVDGEYELLNMNPILFEVFQWLRENKSIKICWFRSENNLETRGRLIHK